MFQRTYSFPPFPIGWFQVAYADEVKPGQVVPLRYFGRDLVAFRGESGRAAVLDAYCPHLGAHLAHGRDAQVIGETVQCPFHCWRFDAQGDCVGIPYAKKVPPKGKLRSWPVVERNGLLMVWHHPLGEAPTWDVPVVPEYGTEEWTGYERRRWRIKTRNQEMAENQVDTAHFHYVHGTMNIPESRAEANGHVMHVVSTTGMNTKRGEVDGSVDSVAYGFGFSTVRFKGIVETLLVGCVTPVEEELVDVRFSFMVRKIGDADITRGVGKAFVAEVSRQLEEDTPIWENKVQSDRPVLCDGDGPIALFRRWCRQFYVWPEERETRAA